MNVNKQYAFWSVSCKSGTVFMGIVCANIVLIIVD